MSYQERPPVPRARDLAWVLVPLLAYLLVLRHFWFNAPVWDDYDAVLDSVMMLMDASSPREWLGALVHQHNEHRIAVPRLISWMMATLFGQVDFRVLVLIGNLGSVAIVVLAWVEFREEVAAPLFAGAAFLMLQLSYYQAALSALTALSNLGVVLFSFACLFFALRDRWPAAAASILCGILAVGSLANGLIALPMAAAACAFAGKRERAWLFASVAVALWLLYFWSYKPNPGHPSPLAALSHSLDTLQLFLIVIGSIAPGRWASMVVGTSILIALAWLTRRNVWKAHPTAGLWVAFVLLSAAAAAAGRVGFGVAHASRYAIYSSCLVVIISLSVCALTRPWSRRTIAFAVLGAAATSFAVSWASWPRAREFSFDGHLLSKTVPPSPAEPYVGLLHPGKDWGTRILRAAEERGLYSPQEPPLHAGFVRASSNVPGEAGRAGHVDEVSVAGVRVSLTGWTHLSARVPGRTLIVFPEQGIAALQPVVTVTRPDVALALRNPDLLHSGFRLDVDYASEADARRFAAILCIAAEAPEQPLTVLSRVNVDCPAKPSHPDHLMK